MSLIQSIDEYLEMTPRHNPNCRTGLQYIVFTAYRARYGLSSVTKNFTYLTDVDHDVRKQFAEFLMNLPFGLKCVKFSYGYHYLDENQQLVMLCEVITGTTSVSIGLSGDVEIVDKTRKLLKETFPKSSISVNQVSSDGDNIEVKSTTIQIPAEGEIAPKMHYPYLKYSAEQMCERFFESSSNVVVLIGPPGTGKSTYLRAALFEAAASKRRIYVIASDLVIHCQKLDVWISTLPTDALIIIEDADTLVSKRTEGNLNMAMLLNHTDGVVSSNRKFIISTNLSNISKIDDALTRPGRCFDVLSFRKLHHEEANAIYLEHNPGSEAIPDTGDLSLSEVLNYNTDVECARRKTNFGFNAS